MSEQTNTPHAAPVDASPEEVEAAMAANVADEISRLQAELAELKAKNAEMADHFLRAKAEAENMRRRAEEEVSKARKFGIESFAESLLPVCDSLDAALAIQNATAEQLREGSDATLRQLQHALERNKVILHQSCSGQQVRSPPAPSHHRSAGRPRSQHRSHRAAKKAT